MGINLRKGQKIDLTKGEPGLSAVMVGLGWDEAQKTNNNGGFLKGFFGSKEAEEDIDCDASVILLGGDGKLYNSQDINASLVYYNNLIHYSDAIIHQGDNRTGEGEGDDEQIFVDLNRVPQDVSRLVFVVNIYEADKRKQHFGMIENAFIRLVNVKSNHEICRYNLSDNYDGMTGLVVGEIYRYQGEWKFNAIGQPVCDASYITSLVNLYS